jgi:hypothetical protein
MPPPVRGTTSYTVQTAFQAETGIGTVRLDFTDFSRRLEGYLAVLDHDKDDMIPLLMENMAKKLMAEYSKRMKRDHERGWIEEGQAGGMGRYLAGDEGQHPRFTDRRHTVDTAEGEYSIRGFNVSVGNAGAILEEGASQHTFGAKNSRKKLAFWGFSSVAERQGIESLGEYLKHPGKSARTQRAIKQDLTSAAFLQQRWKVTHPGYKPKDKPLADSFDYIIRFQGGWRREVDKLMEIVVDRRHRYDRKMAKVNDLTKDFLAYRDKVYENRPTRRRR